VADKLELGLVVLSRTSFAAISLFRSDMERECSRWEDVCRMLDRGDLWHSRSAVAKFQEALHMELGKRAAGSSSVCTYPECILSPARTRSDEQQKEPCSRRERERPLPYSD